MQTASRQIFDTRAFLLVLLSVIFASLLLMQNVAAQTISNNFGDKKFEQDGQSLTQFCNSNPITIPSVGTATPYPSTISVSGLGTSTSGVTVTLNDANHTYRSDLAILLVGPQGQTTMLMFSVADDDSDLIHANITFDDAATAFVPSIGNITGTNTFFPTNPFPQDVPAPAPSITYGADLTQFVGTNPNGDWKLYVYDNFSGDSGNINGGWCLDITTGTPAIEISNPNPITIPSVGTATPYPSIITVSGLPSIATVKVTLKDMNHTDRSDVSVLLVGPQGQTTMLMFSAADDSSDLIHANITFDDAASLFVKRSGNILGNVSLGSISYLPTNLFLQNLPAPAPSMPYGDNLSQFGGTDPNGDWKLYVYDDTGGDSGNINGGWTLDFTSGVPPAGKVVFSSTSYNSNEGTSEIVTVNRRAGAFGAISVGYATSNGTATAGSDYTMTSGTLFWADGDNSSKTFSIPILNDVLSETSPETINLTLSTPTGGATVGLPSVSTARIKDIASLYRNATPIILPVVGAANVYPSTITVSGAPSAVSRVRVSLFGITHGNLGDIDVLLVAPNGANFIVMSDIASGIGGSDFTLTLEDAATGYLPGNAVFNPNGNFKPTNYTNAGMPLDNFSINGGPAAPYGNPGPGLVADTFASRFDGINPNGDWKLYVVDDTNGISGAINGGWSIDFLGPLAATATITGKVQTADGRSISRAVVTIISANSVESRTAITNSFGYYSFDDLQVGELYIISVTHKRYQFTPQPITVFEDLQDINFIAVTNF